MISLKNRTRILLTVLSTLLYLLIPISFFAQEKDSNKVIYRFELHDEISPSSERLVKEAFAEAEEMNADYIIIDLNTYGGLVESADNIREIIINSKAITVVFVRNNAASAGALISISCDSIYMSPEATIGAASVVNQNGELMPEKMQAYMAGKMRATAEHTGRNPEIAAGMVKENIEIPGIKEKGQIITFTTEEAIQHGYCEGKASSVEEVIKKLNLKLYEVKSYQLSSVDKIIGFLLTPAVSGILIMIIIGGIYFELQTPGVGFPLVASITAAVLYFAPHYMEGLAQHWEILIFIVGLILLIIEIFAIPGFGITGISGLALMFISLILALVLNVNLDFSLVHSRDLANALLVVIVPSLLSLILLFAFGRSLLDSPAFKRVSLETIQDKNEGYTIKNKSFDNLIGKTATCVTDLRPSGKVELDGVWYDAQSDAEYFSKGSKVFIIGQRSAYLLVDNENIS